MKEPLPLRALGQSLAADAGAGTASVIAADSVAATVRPATVKCFETITCPTANQIDASVILEQSLDIVELDLRPVALAEPTAQLLEDAAHALHVDLTGQLHGLIPALVDL